VLCGFLIFAAVSCQSVPASVTVAPTSSLLANLSGLLSRFPDMGTDMLSRHYQEKITATGYQHYVIVKQLVDYYDGGAHGVSTTNYRVFDRTKARYVRLSDLAVGAARSDLEQAVIDALGKKSALAEGERLSSVGFFDDRPALTENFFLCEEGIGFHWNPAEIAPFAFGEIEVIVPLK
jgi:hypothetical protein